MSITFRASWHPSNVRPRAWRSAQTHAWPNCTSAVACRNWTMASAKPIISVVSSTSRGDSTAVKEERPPTWDHQSWRREWLGATTRPSPCMSSARLMCPSAGTSYTLVLIASMPKWSGHALLSNLNEKFRRRSSAKNTKCSSSLTGWIMLPSRPEKRKQENRRTLP